MLARSTGVKLVAAVAILLMATSALADTAKDAAAWCADHGGDELPRDATVRWRGRLDGDRREDMILDEGGCGTRECMLGGYVQCADGNYAKVFAQYAARVRVKPQKRGWALLLLEHVGDAPKRERIWSTSRFGANGYDE